MHILHTQRTPAMPLCPAHRSCSPHTLTAAYAHRTTHAHRTTCAHHMRSPHALTTHHSFVMLTAQLGRMRNASAWRSFVYACSLCRTTHAHLSPLALTTTAHCSLLTAHRSSLTAHRSPAPLFAHSLFAVYAILCPQHLPFLLPHHRTQPMSPLLCTHHRNQSLSPHQGVLMRVALLPLSVNRITLCPSSAPANALQIYTKVLLRFFTVSLSSLTSCLQRSC